MYGNKAPTLSGGLYRPVDVCKKSDLNHSCIFFPLSPFPLLKLPQSLIPITVQLNAVATPFGCLLNRWKNRARSAFAMCCMLPFG
jgi:hypothetical protein